jgi:hypothetical protein
MVAAKHELTATATARFCLAEAFEPSKNTKEHKKQVFLKFKLAVAQ